MEHGPAASFLISLPCSLSLPLVGQRVLWQLWPAALLLVFPIPTAAPGIVIRTFCSGLYDFKIDGIVPQVYWSLI